jgi:NADH-quinone oxidoreductase subunit E
MAEDTSPSTVKTEAAMFAAIVGVVAVMLLMVIAGYGVFGAAFRGLLLGVVAFIALLAILPASEHPAAPRASVPAADDHGHAVASDEAHPAAAEAPGEAAAEAAEDPAEIAAVVAVELSQDTDTDIAAPMPVIADLAPVAPVASFAPMDTPAPAAGADGAARPLGLAAPRGGTGDDLKRIKGVGPKIEKALNAAGVWHFDQIAGWSAAELAWVDDEVPGVRGRASRDDWVGQAGRLAQGATAGG